MSWKAYEIIIMAIGSIWVLCMAYVVCGAMFRNYREEKRKDREWAEEVARMWGRMEKANAESEKRWEEAQVKFIERIEELQKELNAR